MSSQFTKINSEKEEEDKISDESSSEDEELGEFVMYKDRPEWVDVKPIPQNESPYKVVSIRYKPIYEDTYNYFRAILASEEISERAFVLTEDCIRLNSSNYTVWHYRRILLEKLNKNLNTEFVFTRAIILKIPKNYQVWEHHKYLLQRIHENQNEYSLNEVADGFKKFFIQVLRTNDSKNYHAWQQRQWLIKTYNNFEGELEFVDQMIDEDIRNNSAWHHRFYVIQNTTGFTEEVIKNECNYTLRKIKLAPNNESPWNYLLAIVKRSSDIYSIGWMMDTLNELLSTETENGSLYGTSHLFQFAFELKILELNQMKKENIDSNSEEFQQKFNESQEYLRLLADGADSIHRHFWNYRTEMLRQLYI